MKDTKTLLSNYFEILNNKRKAKYLQCKKVPINFKNTESTNDLWIKHNQQIKI